MWVNKEIAFWYDAWLHKGLSTKNMDPQMRWAVETIVAQKLRSLMPKGEKQEGEQYNI